MDQEQSEIVIALRNRKVPSFTVAFWVAAESESDLHRTKQMLSKATDPDFVQEDLVSTGTQRWIEKHRMGDYFSSIRTEDSSPLLFRIIFTTKQNPGSYWKDLVVGILRMIREESGMRVVSDDTI